MVHAIPGIGRIAATAITALVPAPEGFRAGRDFAAWLGLTPLQKSTGGKRELGAISKRGERTIRRLLILGASAVVRWAGSVAPRLVERAFGLGGSALAEAVQFVSERLALEAA